MNKKELRKIYKEKRVGLSTTERLKLDDLLLIQLQRLSFGNNTHVVMTFWPIENHGEMNTHLYTRYLEVAIPDIKITFPVIDPVINEMRAVAVTEGTEFVENRYGIYEPAEGETISPEMLDVVFVPLLAFDEDGYRVGYGKGYYDRFLRHCRHDVITVGFSYFEAVDKIDDTNHFDVPLNYCITPHHIYEF
jgi:5-formyltetrahydrofolate cyclo-ligase